MRVLVVFLCVVVAAAATTDSPQIHGPRARPGHGLATKSCPHATVTCRCGAKIWNRVAVTLPQCHQVYRGKSFCSTCEPLDKPRFCSRFSKCRTCLAELGTCGSCEQGSYGAWCESDCPCLNGGTCMENGTCACPQKYEGDICEQEIRETKCKLHQSQITTGTELTSQQGWYRSVKEFHVGDTVSLRCTLGFRRINGEQEVVCTENGVWSGSFLTCVPICSIPTRSEHQLRIAFLDNGFSSATIQLDTDINTVSSRGDGLSLDSVHTLEYLCSHGYVLVGHNRLQCLSSGTWDHAPPTCVRSCGDPPIPRHASISNVTSADGFPTARYIVGTRVHYECEEQYSLYGRPSRQCEASGRWSALAPACVLSTSCPDPGTPSHASRVVGEGQRIFLPDTRVVFRCEPGYSLLGSHVRYCERGGGWSGSQPVCIRVSNASVDCFTRGYEVYSDVGVPVLIRCPALCPTLNPRYTIYGTSIYRKDSHVCLSAQHAGVLPRVPPTKPVYVVQSDVYSTYISSTLHGLRSRSSRVPTHSFRFVNLNLSYEPHVSDADLSPVWCPDPGPLAHGSVRASEPPSVSGYVEGSTLLYSCEGLRWRLEGDERRVCRSSGQWSGQPALCVPVVACDHIHDTSRLTVTYRSLASAVSSAPLSPLLHPVGTVAYHECVSSYYNLVGSFNRICRSDGQWSGSSPSCIPKCGKRSAGRVPLLYGGQASEVGAWPWHVAIYQRMREEERSQGSHQPIWFLTCGAALIDEEWIITAAHCVTHSGSDIPLPRGDIRVVAGKHHRSDDDGGDVYVERRRVSSIEVHPAYDAQQYESDLALVRMREKVVFTHRVRPVCLPLHTDHFLSTENLRPGKVGYITGWGKTASGNYSSILQHISQPVVDSVVCEEAYRNTSSDGASISVTDNMFCAGYRDSSSDACSGDSGGPMVFASGAPNNRRFVLEGIVSWGSPHGCAIPDHYSGYTKVHRYAAWIEAFLC